MKLKVQKRLAADVLRCSEKRVRFDPNRLDEIKESITKVDIKNLMIDKAIYCIPVKGVSRFRARKIKVQKSKGKRKGQGSRKGKATARLPGKKSWINKIRLQRGLLKTLKDNKIIDLKTYRELYAKAKGGFFRSKGHIKLYIEEHSLALKKR
ncbi:MAG: 50S ribosomal protein L19e [Nanoarchaeota archaeon]|nr:50S ribosomal protein L19e [Nanoarchaeota archaeon]